MRRPNTKTTSIVPTHEADLAGLNGTRATLRSRHDVTGVDHLGDRRSASLGNGRPATLAASMERELKRQGHTTRGRG